MTRAIACAVVFLASAVALGTAPASAEETVITPAVLTPAIAALRQQPPNGLAPRLTTAMLNDYIARQSALKSFDGFDVTPEPQLTEEVLLGYIARQQNPALTAIDQLDTPRPALNDVVMETYVERGFTPTAKKVKLAASERDCLAQAIYHEARGETEAGQWAVANIIINRAFSKKYPTTLCGVVFQNADKGRYKCQFTFACDGRSDVAKDQTSWRRALRIAQSAFYEFQRGDRPDVLPANALFYHTTQVSPNWSHTYRRVAAIGSHIFYSPR